jgi:hypothetical protein
MNDGGGFIQLLSMTFSVFCVLRAAGEKGTLSGPVMADYADVDIAGAWYG